MRGEPADGHSTGLDHTHRRIGTGSVYLIERVVRDRKEERCHMSMPSDQGFTLRNTVTVIQSSSHMNSDLTSGNGKPKFVFSHAHTVASRSMLAAIHPAMFPNMPLYMVGGSRWMTSRLSCWLSRSNVPMWWA